MIGIVGYTGFVGCNICESINFDIKGNSKNVTELYGTNPDVLVYSGVKGTKFLANKNPDEDKKNIDAAKHNLVRIRPRKVVLISTVDVYDNLDGVDEVYNSNSTNLHTYGKNRLELETWLKNNFTDYHIVRIPALYGKNLKKNFVHDMINPIPVYLTIEDFCEIVEEFPSISKYYEVVDSGMYHFRNELFDREIYDFFNNSRFNSLRFTDSRAQYQFFCLSELGEIIKLLIRSKIHILNIVTEPVRADDVCRFVLNKDFLNHLQGFPIKYNIKTRYGDLLHKDNNTEGYFHDKQYVLNSLKDYVLHEKIKLLGNSG